MTCQCEQTLCPNHMTGECKKSATLNDFCYLCLVEQVRRDRANDAVRKHREIRAVEFSPEQVANFQLLESVGLPTRPRIVEAPGPMPVVRFVAVGCSVMDGLECVLRAKSKTFAKRTANALNRHKVNSEGV